MTKRELNYDILMKKLDKMIEQKTNEVNSKSFHKASSHWQGFLIKYK